MQVLKDLNQLGFSPILKTAVLAGFTFISFCGIVQANNVSISNVSLVNQNKANNYTHI